MFTGIVVAVGRVVAREPSGEGARIRVDASLMDCTDVANGEIIAVAGCCKTVVANAAGVLAFDVSAETLRCTTGFGIGCNVNLEKALRFGDRLGGHLLSGHVDGVGTVAVFAPVEASPNGNWLLAIDAPATVARFVAAKGSVAVDGVSLTTNTVDGVRFTVNLIPHTLAVTTLSQLAVGATVNLEVDLIARYVERLRQPLAER
jgi:riboflavin synthase